MKLNTASLWSWWALLKIAASGIWRVCCLSFFFLGYIYRESLFFSWKKVELKEKSARFLACKSQLKIRRISISQVYLLGTERTPRVKVTCRHPSWSLHQHCTVDVPSLFYLWEKWRPQGCRVARAEPRLDPARTDPKALVFTVYQPSIRRASPSWLNLILVFVKFFKFWNPFSQLQPHKKVTDLYSENGIDMAMLPTLWFWGS